MKEIAMTYAAAEASIRVNGQDEPLIAGTLAALLEEKAVDTGQRGIAVAVNGAIVPRAAWPQTTLQPGDSIEIVRAFVRLRRMAGSIAELRRKVDALEQKYDVQFRMVFDAIRELMAPPAPGEKRRIGFRPEPPDGVRAARLRR